ncbi:MAG: glycosyltransferase family 39 protein [Deltaproteobacteria bacterium]|nr:glycosyltransferase family 39 protein [Deltaproteobacteria bacterium]
MSADAPRPAEGLSPWEERLRRRRPHVVAGLLMAAVFVRLLLCLQVAGGPLPRIHDLIADSDNRFFDEWAQHLAAGDWLQKEPQHPLHGWMRGAAESVLTTDPQLPVRLGLTDDAAYDRPAMVRTLWDRWLGGPTYFQEPAYPYLVALTYVLTGASAWNVYAWQLVLGVLSVLLIWQLARRLFGDVAGLVAGILSVLAPLPLMLEVTLLRDSLVAFTTLAILLAMLWAPEGSRWRWAVLGMAFGAAVLVKQSFWLFPPLFAAWRLTSARAPWRERGLAGVLVGGGLLALLLPTMARNLIVGVPPFAFNASGAAMLALFHTADASPTTLSASATYARILAATDGQLVPSLLEAMRTHSGLGSFLGLNLQKALYAWHGFEIPNNVDFALFRNGAPVLELLPATVRMLAPLAMVGAIAYRARGGVLYLAIVAHFATLILAAPLSRYRATVLVVLMPLAGAGAVTLVRWITRRRWFPVALASAASAGYLLWSYSELPHLELEQQIAFYSRNGQASLRAKEPGFAALNFQEALRLAPHSPETKLQLGEALLEDRDPEAALPHLVASAAALRTSDSRALLARGLAQMGRHTEALVEARAALEADPDRASMRELVEHLTRGEEAPPPALGGKESE